MSKHAPKLLALEAQRSGRLSKSRGAHLERHLARCQVCREARAAMREYAEQRDAARDLSMPELSWERFEAALDAQAANMKTRRNVGKLVALALPVFAVAATLLVGWLGISGQRHVQKPAQLASPPRAAWAVAPPEETRVTAWVTLGKLQGAPPPGDVHEGDVVRTGPGEERHLHLLAGTGIVLWPESELLLTRLREHSVRLSLVGGGVSSTVQKLGPEASYIVEAGDYTAEVRGTHFFVGHKGEGVRVDVHAGKVAVARRGEQLALLTAGQSFSTLAESVRAIARSAVGLEEASGRFPTLRLPPLSSVAAWHVGGARFSADSMIALRAPAGEVSLAFEDQRGRLRPLSVSLPPEGLLLDEASIRPQPSAHAPTHDGTLPPEQISAVIQTALPNFRRCYAEELQREPRVEGLQTLVVHVAANGHVSRAQLRSEASLPELSRCISKLALGWRFPVPSGGALSFEVQLNLQ